MSKTFLPIVCCIFAVGCGIEHDSSKDSAATSNLNSELPSLQDFRIIPEYASTSAIVLNPGASLLPIEALGKKIRGNWSGYIAARREEYLAMITSLAKHVGRAKLVVYASSESEDGFVSPKDHFEARFSQTSRLWVRTSSFTLPLKQSNGRGTLLVSRRAR